MIGRVLLAALLAGIAAGLIAGVVHQVRIVPLILQAETFETAGAGHSHDHGAAASDEHGDDSAWMPQEGIERTGFTLATMAVAGAGWAAVLVGLSFLLGIPLTRENGLVWGVCGFLAVSLAPAAGLPPELPGMPAADLNARIAWWCFSIACTGFALWLVLIKRNALAMVAALVLVLSPHIIGAPQPASHETAVSAGLVQQFVTSSLAINALFWGLIGVFLGWALHRFEKDATA